MRSQPSFYSPLSLHTFCRERTPSHYFQTAQNNTKYRNSIIRYFVLGFWPMIATRNIQKNTDNYDRALINGKSSEGMVEREQKIPFISRISIKYAQRTFGKSKRADETPSLKCLIVFSVYGSHCESHTQMSAILPSNPNTRVLCK